MVNQPHLRLLSPALAIPPKRDRERSFGSATAPSPLTMAPGPRPMLRKQVFGGAI